MPRLYWVRQDMQGDFDMGELPPQGDAADYKAACLEELLEQCASNEEREDIESGLWMWGSK